MAESSESLVELVERIRTAPIERLQSAAWLENELLPELGLVQNIARFSPQFLHRFCGKGLKSFQHPNQFAKYLVALSTKSISSYCEIGAYEGGTFIITVEYLGRFHEMTKAIAVDPYISAPMKDYAALNGSVQLLKGTLADASVISQLDGALWDLVLIDADHTEAGVTNDFNALRCRAKALALHDIDNDNWPGVRKLWTRVKELAPPGSVVEFCDQYEENVAAGRGRLFGLGVVEVDVGGLPEIGWGEPNSGAVRGLS